MAAETHCQHCGKQFSVDDALAGGITNCPDCGKATRVEGLRDPLWRLAQLAGLAIPIAAGVLVYQYDGAVAGWCAGLGTAVILWLISRGF